VEKSETSLKQKLQTVHKDKNKIQETISTLDKFKLEALTRTWESVSK
jgi:structural maintenance of chromosome 2